MAHDRPDFVDGSTAALAAHPPGCACCSAPASKAAIDHAAHCGGCSACRPGEMKVSEAAELSLMPGARGVTI